MKAEEVHNCDGCDGPLVGTWSSGKTGNFYRVKIDSMIPDAAAVRERSAYQLMGFGGALAEVFATKDEVAHSAPMAELLLCFNCMDNGNILDIIEKKSG